MATSTGPVFSGQSTYSADFQQVLTRAVGIAQLPIQFLQNNISTLTGKQEALQTLGTQFASLQDAVQAISTAVNGSITAQSSQSSSVSATATSSALPGTYSIQVDNPGTSTSTLSAAGLNTVTDPTVDNISSSSTFKLTDNGIDYTINPSGNSLEDLASAINASGAAVHATIVNLGSNSTPDYRLAISSDNLGTDSIQLTDGTNNNNLLDTLSTGTPATYEVNGGTTQLQSNSSQITLAPGLTVNLQAATTGAATITVASNYNSLQNALQSFATTYNATVDEVSQQRGTSGGALSGESTVFAMSQTLESISQYAGGSGAVSNLTAMGMTLDSSGHLTFDPTAFSSDDIAAVQQFLGSAATSGTTGGSGFLQAASNAIAGLEDPNTGLLTTDINQLGDQITNLNTQVTDDQNRVNDMQTALLAQLTAADAAIATLQSQKSYLTSLFDATYLTTNNGTQNG